MTPHFRNLLAGLLSLLCFSAYAQDYQYSVFVDADLNDGVGCDVVLPGLGETISGVEFRLTAHVGNQPRVVTDVTREQCTGGTFGAPVSLGTSHAVGFDNGLAAGDVVEWSDFRSNITDNPGQARLYFTATSNMAGGEDVLLTTDGGPNGGPIIIGLFFIIPALGGFGLLLMALLLVLTGVRHKKLLRGLVSSGLLLTAFAVWAANHMDDGMIGDWSDQTTVADDPLGDQFGPEAAVDLIGCFAVEENARIYFRCDLVDVENQPPVALDDMFATDEDTSLNIAAPGVMSNDSDPDPGDMISVTAFDALSTQGATVNVNADGSFSYDPTGAAALQALSMGEVVGDTFTYTISDLAGATDTATVTVDVTGVNDPPVANDDTGATDEDTVLNVPAAGVLANDTDIDANDTLTVSAFDAVSVMGATVSVNADGSYSYDPTGSAALQALAQGTQAMDTFTYTITDSIAFDTATVTITVDGVNDPPVANDDMGMTDEDTVINAAAPGVLGNDVEIDTGDSISVTAFDAVSTEGAAVTVNADGSYVYDPTGSAALQALAMGEQAVDTFTYTIEDTFGASDIATVTITVDGLNDPPVANDDTDATDEDTIINAVAPGVLANDTDVDASDTVTVSAFDAVSVQGATVSVAADGSYSYDPTAAMALQALNMGDTVMDTFTYTITDGTAFDTATVTVTVSGINDAPVANDEMTMTDEDVPVMIDVLANDTDVDGILDPATVMVTAGPTIGMTMVNPGNGIVTYTPNLNQFGMDSFTYQACDNGTPVLCDSATVDITVMAVDDPPVAVDDMATVVEDSPNNVISVLANDTDIDGGPIAVGSVTQPANGVVINNGTDVSYTPDPNYCNDQMGGMPDTFMYTLAPGGSTATVSVEVTCVNDPPMVGAPGPFDVTGNIMRGLPMGTLLAGASDPDGMTTLTAELRGIPTNGASVVVSPDGSFTYDPGAGYTGMASFDFRVCDDGIPLPSQCSADQTVNINIADIIWFINQGDGGTNQGTLANPFNSMGSFDAVNDNTGTNPGNGDTIFLFSGTTVDPVTLLDGQFLIGQGASASISAITGIVPPPGSSPLPMTGGARPVMTTTNMTAITLAAGNTIRGLDVGNNGSGTGIDGNAIGTATISEMAIGGTGEAINIVGGGMADFTFDSISSTNSSLRGVHFDGVSGVVSVTTTTSIAGSANDGIRIANASGSFDFGATTVSSAGTGISLSNSAGATFTFDSMDITTSNGIGLQTNAGGTVNIGGVSNTINATGGNGIIANSTSFGGGATFSSVSSANSSLSGIQLAPINEPFTVNGGTITDPTTDGITIIGGNGNFTYAGSISNAQDEQVYVAQRSGGTVTFSGPISTNVGRGITVENNFPAGAASITFTNSMITLAPSLVGSDAVVLQNNTANLSTSFSGGGLQITAPTNGRGYVATGAQNLSVTGTGNSISAASGDALVVMNSTISGMGMTFESISSNNASTNGITLLNTGASGGLTVTGTGTNAIAGNSGGTIQNSTGAGISLTSTLNPSFDSVTILNTGSHGIDGMDVDGLLFSDGLISGAGNANMEDGVHLVDSIGMIDFDNTRFTDSAEDLFSIENTNADVSVMVTNSELIETTPPFGNDAVTIQVQGTSNVIADISNNAFGDPLGGLFGNAIDVGNAVTGGVMLATGSVTLTATGNTIDQNSADLNKGGGFKVSGQDTMLITTTYTGNAFDGAKGNGVISFDGNDGSTIRATVGGPGGFNTIDNATNSNGIVVLADENATVVADIDGNILTNIGTDGIQVANFALLGQAADMDITIDGNTVNGHNVGGAPFFAGIDIFGGGETGGTCINLINNSVSGTPGGFFDYNLDDFGSTMPLMVQGPTVNPVMAADILLPVGTNAPVGGLVGLAGSVQFSNGVPCDLP